MIYYATEYKNTYLPYLFITWEDFIQLDPTPMEKWTIK